MPNWCRNILTINGDPQDLRNFFLVGCSQGERVIPDGPDNVTRTPILIPLQFANFVPQPKFDNDGAWYQWNIDNWGTKWDLDYETDATIETIDDGTLMYTFDTAWSPPTPWVEAVTALYPDLSFHLEYSEPGSGFIGESHGVGGVFEDNARNMELIDDHNGGWHSGMPAIECPECEPEDFQETHESDKHQPEEHSDCTVCQHLLGQHAQPNNQCPQCLTG